VKIPTSKTPEMFLIFSRNNFGFFITPKLQSRMMFPFSVMNGYPLSSVLSLGLPPIFEIFLVTVFLAKG